ncbi:hypothetical protein DdX_08289 [Ditylenchus destructor]|uniref:Uncharacterized protein n=1 Tax=Ditylenchus destructor TaxID=166010 RepID=A0AAD4N475_9BILA|nr:hypothetical protein DdX_08289 [Ditylenchus destructor]
MEGAYLGIVRDIFALFTRPEIAHLTEANRRYKALIESEFASSPCVIVAYLHFQDGQLRWSNHAPVSSKSLDDLRTSAQPMPPRKSAQLASSKFLRFKHSDFVFTYCDPMDVIGEYKHLYQNGGLRIVVKNFQCPAEVGDRINIGHYLHLIVPGSLKVLSQILRSSFTHISIKDNANNTAEQLPVALVVDFLFRSRFGPCQCSQPTSLIVSTHRAPKCESYEEIISAIEKKFLATSKPPYFGFAKYHKGNMNWPEARDFTLDHPNSEMKLHLTIRDGNSFSLTSSVKKINPIKL